jgi:glucan 1,3-beta-glucosidase
MRFILWSIPILTQSLSALALGSKCSGELGSGSATGSSFWMETIERQGTSAFNSDASYKVHIIPYLEGSHSWPYPQVYRNVKDYGAKGDGATDDTAAINLAITGAFAIFQ